MLRNLGAGELLLIVLIILVLFGGKKIPDLMHGIGKGINEFKRASQADPAEAVKTTPTPEPPKV